MKFPEDFVNCIVHGDSENVLKEIPENSVDLLVTDPPYGYSFMGKSWDKALPSVDIWKECLRVLKPGAFAFIMSAPRSDVLSRVIVRIEDAGFRVNFSPIYWTYASGFPKAMNIGKMVDKRLGHTRKRVVGGVGTDEGYSGGFTPGEAISGEASSLNGSYGGFQPKPAVEVIIVAMKPLSEKTFVDQALKASAVGPCGCYPGTTIVCSKHQDERNKTGRGVTWLDDCRIPTNDDLMGGAYQEKEGKTGAGEAYEGGFRYINNYRQPTGRFPANLLVSDDVLNDGKNYISSGGITENVPESASVYGVYGITKTLKPADSGSYSRYFDLDTWWAKTYPFLIVPKASKGEKNDNLDDIEGKYMDASREVGSPGGTNPRNRGAEKPRQNFHPTTKPIKLMSYLITLGSRTDDIVLDPFSGSGTTPLAAHFLKRKYIGIEREKEYCEIARKRLKQRQEVLL